MRFQRGKKNSRILSSRISHVIKNNGRCVVTKLFRRNRRFRLIDTTVGALLIGFSSYQGYKWFWGVDLWLSGLGSRIAAVRSRVQIPAGRLTIFTSSWVFYTKQFVTSFRRRIMWGIRAKQCLHEGNNMLESTQTWYAQTTTSGVHTSVLDDVHLPAVHVCNKATASHLGMQRVSTHDALPICG